MTPHAGSVQGLEFRQALDGSAQPWQKRGAENGGGREFGFWEPTFDHLVRGPGPHGRQVEAVRRPAFVRLARARRVAPRRAAGAVPGQR